jgi:hypothetical protein
MKNLLIVILICISTAITVWGQSPGPERTLPRGDADCRLIEIVASQSVTILPYWNKSRIILEQADGVTEKFRVAIGTTTVDTSFPMRTSYDLSIRGSTFFAIQAATDTANLVITQVRED